MNGRACLIAVFVICCATSAIGADLNRELISAAAAGNLDEVKNLLASGADVNAASDKGKNSLAMAREFYQKTGTGRKIDYQLTIAVLHRAGAR